MINQDLLILRLETLRADVEKVRVAVDKAQSRGALLDKATRAIQPCNQKVQTVRVALYNLTSKIEVDEVLRTALEDAAITTLGDELTRIEDVAKSLSDVTRYLKDASARAVRLDDRLETLTASLNQRCNAVQKRITTLKTRVEEEDAGQRQRHWRAYQAMLDGTVRPIFMEYVDFLGGLTVRDTGLDDRVCDLTAGLLTRFGGVTTRSSLPLPAREAALGSALESVVLLGFPEWSIWGIPLVGHEVGLAYSANRNDDDLVNLVDSFAQHLPTPAEPPEQLLDVGAAQAAEPAEPHDELVESPVDRMDYIHHLVADAFGAYTLGFAYACAALLLRLEPGVDDKPSPTRPRDIDRARVIMLTLENAGLSPGGSFSEDRGSLRNMWMDAVGARAGSDPKRKRDALEQAEGPPPSRDWLDDFSEAAVKHFANRMHVRRFDDLRWEQSTEWMKALRGEAADPDSDEESLVVLDLLTAAWRLRLEGQPPEDITKDVVKRWSARRPRR